MKNLSRFGAALLHDVVEGSDITSALLAEEFPEPVIPALKLAALARNSDPQRWAESRMKR